jgi:hypothetical protein
MNACENYAITNEDIEIWEELIIISQQREAAAVAAMNAATPDVLPNEVQDEFLFRLELGYTPSSSSLSSSSSPDVIEIIDLTADDPEVIDLTGDDDDVLTVISEVSELTTPVCVCRRRKFEHLGYNENGKKCRFF